MKVLSWLTQPAGADGYINAPDEAFAPADLIELFSTWKEVMASVETDDPDRYLWRIIGEPLWVGMNYAGNPEIELDLRCDMVRSMKNVMLAIPELHAPGEPMIAGYFMWWDVIAPALLDDPSRQVCLDLLSELCDHADARVQAAALHGLGHLRWPGTDEAVQRYIDAHPNTGLDKNWLAQCRDGSVM